MKNYVVTDHNQSIPLEDTVSGYWSQGFDGNLYLTLDEGFVCFIYNGHAMYFQNGNFKVRPLADNCTVTFTQIAAETVMPMTASPVRPARLIGKRLAKEEPLNQSDYDAIGQSSSESITKFAKNNPEYFV